MVSRGLLAGLAVLTATSSCASVELAAPIVRSRRGPAADAPVRRVVAVPATCGALTMTVMGTDANGNRTFGQREGCPPSTLLAIDQLIRSNLELGGYSVIDLERVNALTATRHEVQERTLLRSAARTTEDTAAASGPGRDTTTTETETRGARFEDATPLEQRELLAELGAQGLLTTRVTVGAEVGVGLRRIVMVQLQLLDMPERRLVWAQRCELEIGGIFATDDLAMVRAARCASEGLRAR